VLGRNRIKHLNSLKIKKYRNRYRQFIVEGDKIVSDLLKEGIFIRQLIATREWLDTSSIYLKDRAGEIIETGPEEISRVSSLESSPAVLAVVDIPETKLDCNEISGTWSIALDTIQDPGNLGNIIRIADWFGIRHLICNEGCADCFSPKVVQASMGALFRVKIYYAFLPDVLRELRRETEFPVYGTFTGGIPVYEMPVTQRGMVVFGNESRGISEDLFRFITSRITIPAGKPDIPHVESLNVASSVAIVCSVISRA
jgi:TrmH family RNA methyltransferase